MTSALYVAAIISSVWTAFLMLAFLCGRTSVFWIFWPMITAALWVAYLVVR